MTFSRGGRNVLQSAPHCRPPQGLANGDWARCTEIELFVRVAETASLARAAEVLDLSHAAANRKHLSAEVRTFIDFAAAHFPRQDDERAWTGRFGV